MEHITLTVLPFENLSQSKELAIFCRSFSGELITELSRFRQFRVINLPVANTDEPGSTDVLDTIKTDYFVQGTFRCEKDVVRINVQLYNSETHQMIWGNRLEGQLANALSQRFPQLRATSPSILMNSINNL